MKKSQSISIGLIAVMGMGFAFTARAEERIVTHTTTTRTIVTSVKKPVKKVVHVVKPAVKPAKLTNKAPKTSLKASPKTVMVKPETAPVVAPTLPTPPLAPTHTSATTLVVTPKPEAPKKPWMIGGGAEWSPENDVQKDSFVNYIVLGNYKLSHYHSFGFDQRISQVLLPKEGKDAVTTVLDPRFIYEYTFTEPETKNVKVSMRFRSQPGWSDDSQLNGVKAVNSLRLQFKKSIGDFSFGLRPYVAHYWTEYSVNAKNQPLPLFSVGHNLLLEYKLASNWSWCLEVDTTLKMLQPEEVRSAAALNVATSSDPGSPATIETVKTDLSVLTELAYKINSNFATKIGYAQEDGLMAEGRYTMNFLAQKTSRYYLGVELSY